MATAQEIVGQMQLTVPRVTNLFSDTFSVTSLTRSGSTVTAVTSTPHGFSTGNYVNIFGAIAAYQVISLTQVNNIATGVTAPGQPHDLTDNFQPTIVVTGANEPEYNGNALPFIHQANRNTFTYQISGNPSSPATGSNILMSDGGGGGYNGRFLITVIDAVTFTYTITTTPYSPALGNISVGGNVRISASSTFEKASESYTRKNPNELWAFIVLGAYEVSKDRHILNDGSYLYTPGQSYRQLMFQKMHIYVFVPATFEIAGRIARDQMEEVTFAFLRALIRYAPTNLLTDKTQYGITFLGHDIFFYNDAYLVEQFNFELPNWITYDDGVDPDPNHAYRDTYQYFNNSPQEVISTHVDQDDEPE